ncbi:hypothetical protein GF327_00475 [Candidatus Woesearchaeota archaeon]|nr:hypothetical protein [Candidatus Woesearchaeota archaeon]
MNFFPIINSVLSNFVNWILQNKYPLIFYTIIFLVVYLNRKKFEIQAKIIALYRTKIGLNFIEKAGTKYKELIKLFGYIGVGIGFIGMVYITVLLASSFVNIFIQPKAPSAFAPVVPGVKIPGSPIVFPFWYTIISLFLVTIVHEAAHGLVAKAHGLKVESTGIAFFGPLLAAFVEPNEDQIKKQEDIVQYSIFSAGPFSNIIFALLAVVILSFAVSPVISSLQVTQGYSFYSITPNSPAFNASVPANQIFTKFNGVKITNKDQFYSLLSGIEPGQKISIENDENNYEFEAVANPQLENNPDLLKQNPEYPKAIIGITASGTGEFIQIHKKDELKYSAPILKLTYQIFNIFSNFLFWFFVLSSGIGIANLLPLGPVDGGRMLQVVFQKIIKKEKKANDIWVKVSLVTFALVLISFLFPIIRAIVTSLGFI